MFEVVYENQSKFQWSSDFIFNNYEDANQFLLNQGFTKARNGFESNWDAIPKAYITPKKIYQAQELNT
jgi:hypothetical protein